MSKQFDKLVFYNHYGTGDLFTARQFVKEIISHNIAKEYFFAHHHDPYLLGGIENLQHCYTDGSYYFSDRLPFSIVDNTLYFNTWIGYAYHKYVEGIATCTLDNFRRMYNDTLTQIGFDFRLENDLWWYIPNGLYPTLENRYISNVQNFVSGREEISYYNPDLILISNGDVQSGQAENFDFTPVILRLCDDFPEKKIIITQGIGEKYHNLFTTNEIIGKDGCDLLEIAFLSLFCNTIIGRSSGPFVYSQTKQNYSFRFKKFLSFTYEKKAGHMAFWENDERIEAKRFWNNKLDYNIIVDVIKS